MIHESSAKLHQPQQENPRFVGFSDKYHRLGPMADLSEGGVVREISDSALELMGPNYSEMMQSPKGFEVLSDNERTDLSSMFRDLADASIISSRKGSVDPNGDLAKAESMYELSVRTLAKEGYSIADLCSIDEAKLAVNTLKGVDQDRSEFRTEILKRLLMGRQMRSQELYDGAAFEYTFVMAAQYYYWSREEEGLDYSCRLSRTREDMPARGMSKEAGTRVAHDAVLKHKGRLYRIQTKFGEQKMGSEDRYDQSKVSVIAEEGMDGEALNAFIQDIREAYRGDPISAARVTKKVEAYLGQIVKPTEAVKDFAGGLLVSV
jgi:hypothetical protein